MKDLFVNVINKNIMPSEKLFEMTHKDFMQLYHQKLESQELSSMQQGIFRSLNIRLNFQSFSPEATVADFCKLHHGWLGFENNEPGFMANITTAFCETLNNLINQSKEETKELTLDFIKNIHVNSCQKVQNMVKDTIPGQLRDSGLY